MTAEESEGMVVASGILLQKISFYHIIPCQEKGDCFRSLRGIIENLLMSFLPSLHFGFGQTENIFVLVGGLCSTVYVKKI